MFVGGGCWISGCDLFSGLTSSTLTILAKREEIYPHLIICIMALLSSTDFIEFGVLHLLLTRLYCALVGYHTSPTYWWSPVRDWAKSFTFSHFSQNSFFCSLRVPSTS